MNIKPRPYLFIFIHIRRLAINSTMHNYQIAAVVIITIVLKSTLAQMDIDAAAETIEYQNEIDENGQYKFKFATSNGLKRSEVGNIDPDGALVVQGTYEYVDPDGTIHSVRFYADKTGYHPTIISKEQELPVDEAYADIPPSVVASLLG